MEVFMIKQPGGQLWPADDAELEKLATIKNGVIVRADVVVPRNEKNHRRFFALLSVVAQYSETYDNKDKALLAVKIAAGHCDFLPNPRTGELIAVPRSISFAKMDEAKFQEFFNNAVQGVLSHILKTFDRRTIDEAVERVIRF